jgi:hypothetical protein
MDMKTQNPVINDEKLIAYCGLYCAACGKYLKGNCPGCAGNEKATWCGVRKCNIASGYKSCAECNKYSDITQCRDYNNPIAKIIGFILRSNRKACIERIKSVGRKKFAEEMASAGKQTIRR